MSFDFDTPLPLWGAHCTKYDGIKRVFGAEGHDVIPMWVADMDFKAAPAILNAAQKEIDRGYMGYFTDPAGASEATSQWMSRRHGWSFSPEAVRFTHGVIGGLGVVVSAFSEPGDRVVVFSPVYHAFYRQIRAMGRDVLESQLAKRYGQFELDLDALKSALNGRERILILCSPHNPGGRIWAPDELRAIAAFCAENDLILISDEIHADLVFPGVAFTPTMVAAPEHADRTVVLTAASKAFNIAGVETGLLIAPDSNLMSKLEPAILDRESSPNRFGMAMVEAAFTDGEEWLDEVRTYLAENFRLLFDRLNALPGVTVMDMQSTYLAWVDMSALGMDDSELLRRFVEDAKVAPSPGTQFETGGSGHMRLNVALPRATLIKALDRIETAFADIQ